MHISLTSDIEYVIDSIIFNRFIDAKILKAQIEANFNDVELHTISAIKLE